MGWEAQGLVTLNHAAGIYVNRHSQKSRKNSRLETFGIRRNPEKSEAPESAERLRLRCPLTGHLVAGDRAGGGHVERSEPASQRDGGDDPGERSVEELLHSHHDGDPADNVVSSERMQTMRDSMAQMLSGLEVDVLKLYVEGKSYQEIGAQLGRHVKSIDNALQRIKRKLDHHLQLEAAHEAHELASIG